MKRYWHYLRICFEMSLYRALEYRAGVIVQYTLDMIWYAVQFALLRTAYQYVPHVGGYELHEAYVFLIFLYATDAMNMLFFEGGITHYTQAIRNGTLDFYLLKPISTLYQLTLARVNLSGVFNLIFTIGFTIFVFSEFTLDYDFGRWFWAILLFANGLAINTILRLITASVAFWTTEGGTLNWLFHEVMRFGNKPEAIYTGRLRSVLTTFVPVLLVSAWPAMALVRGFSFEEAITPFGITAILIIVLKFVWWHGVRKYEGLSFQ